MTDNSVLWSPFEGSGVVILTTTLFLVAGTLLYVATRLHHPIVVKRPGKVLSVSLVLICVLSMIMYLTTYVTYMHALAQQVGQGHIIIPANPVTPVTITSAVVTFFVIEYLTYIVQRRGLWIAVGSAIIGTIAALSIFEFPFDLILVPHMYVPGSMSLYSLLVNEAIFLVEISSIALLTLSPAMRLSRYTLFLLAGMFFFFAIWALFGFAYPSTPLPTAMNMISKVLAFATAASLFLPQAKTIQADALGESTMEPYSSSPDPA